MSLLGRSLRGAWQRLAGTLLLACILAPGVALAAADVRILIDVSGSMKENDPANLRVPAMRLMSELLPAGTVAGVWLFAEDATPLIAPAPVDEAWRQRARAELPKIHARGLFTDIERALTAATADWQGPPGERERHVLLLTDGVVDVSKVPQESAASRERILSAQLAQLTASGAHVHAVALSDKVDRELIEALTAGTGGWLERADEAARLQRIFLHMLEQTAPPVTVPLEGNRFDIDKSVSELTLLVFREGDVPVTLTPPGATTAWTADSAPAPVQWRHEAGYDLVTVAQPPPGNWQFTGTSDPDNRAVVVTNLALELARLPASLLASESARLDARMVSGGQHVTRLDLLELVAAGYTLAAADGTSTPGQLALDGERAVFSGELGATADAVLAPGVYQVTVTADAGSFKRQAVTRMRIVADPVSVAYSVDPASQAAVEVAVTADASLTRPDTLEGYVSVTDAANLVRVLPLPVASEDGIARVSVAASSAGRHEVAVHAFVTTPGGALRVAPPAQVFELAWTPPVAEPEARAEPEPPPPSGVAWGRFAAYVGGGNAVLALGLGLAWFVFGRTRKPAEAAA